MVTVDGVHARTREFYHELMSKNPKLYSHKFNQAGLTYEIALSVYEDRCVHINGPFYASVHDKKVFEDDRLDENGNPMGLKYKIPEGHLVIGDKGYRGCKNLSCSNSHDTPEVRKMKGRARARQEAFNKRIKTFQCLDTRFRHAGKKHHLCFEAVVVICQYQLENGSPLFDV